MTQLVKLAEQGLWPADIHEIQNGDDFNGGPPDLDNSEGHANVQAAALAARTQFLLTLSRGAARAVISRRTSPPTIPPTAGDAYLIASGASGLWAGFSENIAVWSGSSWQIYPLQEGQIIMVGGGSVYMMTGGIASPWLANFGAAGPVELASKPEVLAGQDNSRVVTPQNLAFALGKTGDGLPLNLKVSNKDQPSQSIPHTIVTRCDNMVAVEGNAQGLWNGQQMVVTPDTLGVWGIFCSLNTNGEMGEGAYVFKNGERIGHYQLGSQVGPSNVCAVTVFAYLTEPGDVIEFYHEHRTGSPVLNNGSDAYMVRLLPYLDPN
ncbi:DUF2793 domain-containing protein [Salipiger sp. IMCC34102]|uniref:DUF2793 domain-containing protein n=1 Tax=Salipiger sp. IMCC34102 TaxID=2510647 RepID=UPI00101D8A6C|nr:DUF2793 domain-containing protein [Salipiger sp. IMCC34102]RYH04131.1 DUF2793 domain-containing protein [Salipiger sp. IMCC34102]